MDMFIRYNAVCLVTTLVAVYGATTLTTTINGHPGPTNMDTVVRRHANVSISCTDDVTSRTGNLRVNGETTLPSPSSGEWMISLMSVEDQGAYECCVDGLPCQEIAIISELKALSGVTKFLLRPRERASSCLIIIYTVLLH